MTGDPGNELLYSVEGEVGIVAFNRPAAHNALTFDMYERLGEICAGISADGSVRALIVTGAGGRAFGAGTDISLFRDFRSGEDGLAYEARMEAMFHRLERCPVPIIAAVHGMAAGAGAVIALAADFRVCTPAARFAFLFTKVGLSGGDMGAAYLLPRLVGLGHATRLLMLGDTVNAEEAERIGLVSLLAGKDTFDDEVGALAGRLASGPVQAYAQTKALLTREQDMSLSAAIELEAMTQALLMKGEDYAEFHAAFNAGRPPQWTGR